ncbi:MAG: aminotransferase [Caulobacteraceae bacterium]
MVNKLYAQLGTTIFTVMSGLAREHEAINLGQGFPDEPGPLAVRERAAHEAIAGDNQYPPMLGLPALRAAVADHYRRRQGLDLDPAQEVMITSGATEALAAAFLALIEPGDEVVLFQPLYDSYLPMVRRAGGRPRLIRLEPPHWRISREALESAFTERTSLVVLNNPVNPTGHIWPDEDLAMLAEFCRRFDAVAVCDEVWEEVVLEGGRFAPLMSFPGMRGRCVKIGSAGKMFALTGWKVGFLCAAPPLMELVSRSHQFLTFTTPPNLQAAVAFGLATSEAWFSAMPRRLAASCERLSAGLRGEGFDVLTSEATWFLDVGLPASGVVKGDLDFCLQAVREAGVAAIPVSAFYETDPVTTVIRLCHAKADATLDEGVRRLAKARDLARASDRRP